MDSIKPVTEITAGDLDQSFASLGIYTFDSDLIEQTYGVITTSQRKILISATKRPYPYHYALIRLDENGALDPSFGNDGTGIAHDFFVDNVASHATSCIELSNGDILLSGVYQPEPGIYEAAISRLDSNGKPDLSFGSNGVAYINATAPTGVSDCSTYPRSGISDPWPVRSSCTLTPLPEGEILFSKTFIYSVGPDRPVFSILGRLLADGTLDTKFQDNGYVYIKPELENNADCHVITPEGKIVVAGHLSTSTPTMYINRYNSDGTADLSFGNLGSVIITSPLGKYGFVTSLISHSKNKLLLVANYTAANSENNGLLFSFEADGSRDLSFNGGDSLAAALPGSASPVEWRNTVEDQDGFILLGDMDAVVLARYLKTGVFDANYGQKEGWVMLNSTKRAFDLTRQTDRKVVVTGWSLTTEGVVARFLSEQETPQAV
ncbi:hypothetical protein AFK24_19320 [Pseudomonas syringae]|uniref:Delta-60 repeat protein n=1 Tax=Pseudomonas syringae TaxID=317 RepID=A0A1C7Z283_PSESX|nr:hypothetical protein [Pseudomonas syringae]OCR23260.1 hypothetical protein AFK24_19320 [Pseudomonas syringae]